MKYHEMIDLMEAEGYQGDPGVERLAQPDSTEPFLNNRPQAHPKTVDFARQQQDPREQSDTRFNQAIVAAGSVLADEDVSVSGTDIYALFNLIKQAVPRYRGKGLNQVISPDQKQFIKKLGSGLK